MTPSGKIISRAQADNPTVKLERYVQPISRASVPPRCKPLIFKRHAFCKKLRDGLFMSPIANAKRRL